MAKLSLDSQQNIRMHKFLQDGVLFSEMLDSKERNHLHSEAKSMSQKPAYKRFINQFEREGMDMLHYCVENEKHLMLALMLKYYKLNPNETETDRPLLHIAVKNGNVKAVKCLFEGFHTANVDAVDDYGTTALQVAVYHDKADILQMLLDHNARTDLEDFLGTAVHSAVILERKKMLTAILAKYPDQVDNVVQGFCSPLMCAILDDADECENSIIKVCDVQNRSFLYSVITVKQDESTALKAVEVLLLRGANPNHVEEGEIIPIIAAAKKNWVSVIEKLLPGTTKIEM